MKRASRIAISVFASVAMAAASTGVAFAGGSEGGVSGGGGQSGCGHSGWTLDTCYGATWRYYETNSDEVEIKGINKDYARGGKITGCAAAGGYWRYGMVAYGNGKYSDGSSYSKGEQVGMIGISGNSDRVFNTRMFSMTGVSDPYAGGMNFIGGSDYWNMVRSFYKNAQERGIANLEIGFDPGSNLSWFCSYEDTTPPDTPVEIESACETGWNPVAGTEKFGTNGVKYNSSVVTKFKKNNGDWNVGKIMYAKPGDLVSWTHCYFPGAINAVKNNTIFKGYSKVAEIYKIYSNSMSKTAKCVATKIAGKQCNSEGEPAVEGGNIVAAKVDVSRDDIVNDDTNWQDYRGALGVLGNSFSVFSSPADINLSTKLSLDNTDSNPAYVINNYSVGNNVVGARVENGIVVTTQDNTPKSISIVDKIKVNLKSSTHISSIGIDIEKWNPNGHSAGDGYWDQGTVYIPYNFNLIPTVSLSGVAYAGETVAMGDVNTSIVVGNRTNNVTGGTYATAARDVKAKLKVSICNTGSGEGCTETHIGDEVKNIGRMEANEEKKGIFNTVNVPDVDAGKYFCVSLMVSPYSSNGDTDMKGNVENWGESAPSCIKVAKRPSFQVWGSSVQTNSTVRAGRSVKNNVNGIIDYAVSGKVSGARVFGSWVDFSIAADGMMRGLASGHATMGGRFYSGEEDTGVGYCKKESPLTIANFGSGLCPTVAVTGNSGIRATIDRRALLGDMKEANLGHVIEIDRTGAYDSGNNIYLSAADVNGVNGSPVTAGVSKIIHTDGDIIITEDLRIYNNDEYSTLSSIPKLIIFARNIKIRCNVQQVDATLVADKNVETCVTESAGEQEPTDVNLSIRSVPLRINGVVLADVLKLGRTYGARAGDGSSIPAEVINYDSTMLLWSRDNADSSNTRRMETTYIQELSPRY